MLAALLAVLLGAGVIFQGAFAEHVLRRGLSGGLAMAVVLAFPLATLVLGAELGLCALGARTPTRVNVRLLTAVICLLVVGSELFLRHGLGRYWSWRERNGGKYSSAFGGGHPGWLLLREPQRLVVVGKSEFQLTWRTNSLGLRDGEIPQEKPPGELRVLALGDSFTEGLGAGTQETWPKQLEERLRERYPDRPLRVMNAGRSGSDAWYATMLLEERLLAYHPDLVVLAINESDGFDMIARGGRERFRSDGTVAFRPGPGWEWLYASSFIVRHIVHDLADYDRRLLGPRDREQRTREGLEQIRAAVHAMHGLAEAHGFRLLVVFHPVPTEIIRETLTLGPLVESLKEEGAVPVASLLDFFLGPAGVDADNVWSYFWRTDTHHNPAGYALLAEGIERALVETGQLE